MAEILKAHQSCSRCVLVRILQNGSQVAVSGAVSDTSSWKRPWPWLDVDETRTSQTTSRLARGLSPRERMPLYLSCPLENHVCTCVVQDIPASGLPSVSLPALFPWPWLVPVVLACIGLLTRLDPHFLMSLLNLHVPAPAKIKRALLHAKKVDPASNI